MKQDKPKPIRFTITITPATIAKIKSAYAKVDDISEQMAKMSVGISMRDRVKLPKAIGIVRGGGLVSRRSPTPPFGKFRIETPPKRIG